MNMFAEYREKRGLTQEQLKEISKVSVSTISAIENNAVIPNAMTFSKLIHALNISMDDVYNYILELPDEEVE